MSREQFSTLITDFCKLTKLQQAIRVIEGAPIEIDQVAFSLIYSDEADVMFCYCEFGEAPQEKCADAYRALLELNFLIYGLYPFLFSIFPESGNVLLTCHLQVNESLTAKSLLEKLTIVADKANQWRADYYVGNTSEEIIPTSLIDDFDYAHRI